MEAELYQRAGRLFQQAVDLPQDSWDAFLNDSCGGDDSLRDAVLQLLQHDCPEHDDTLLGRPLVDVRSDTAGVTRLLDSDDPAIPTQFGRYRIIRLIGRGGMGVVYEAEQDQPQRRVALKVLAPHSTSDHAVSRFEREAEILGCLRHPGIAQIHDAGTVDTEHGTQPFITMELVDGLPLTRYATANDLDIDARLSLIADVCDAVHHAHLNGVIHRDLKPDNVLVTERGDVKVLDFGIAHVTTDRGPVATMTVEGQIVGTLNYMSPEQIGTNGTVDARSDVYALGAMLYEMLADRQPHDLRNCSLPEAARILQDDDPPPLDSIDRAFRGDLTTIAGKAMAKEPSRRYETAAELGADIMRVLQDQPILARPASRIYTTQKFVRRHRAMIAGVTLAFGALIAGTAIATWQAIAAHSAKHSAQQSAATATAVTDFLINEILTASTPNVAQGEAITLQQAFERAAGRLSTLDDQPGVQADLNYTLGASFLNLGDYATALLHFQDAMDWRVETLGKSHRDSIEAMLGVCSALKRIPPFDDALPLQLEAHQLALAEYGQHDWLTLNAMNNVGTMYNRLRRFEEGGQIFDELWSLVRESELDEDEEILIYEVAHNLANSHRWREDHAASIAMFDIAIEGKTRLLGESHPSTLLTELAAAIGVYRTNDWPAAVDRFEGLFPRVKLIYGEDHPHTTLCAEFFAGAVVQHGVDLARVEPHLRAAIAYQLIADIPKPEQLATNYSLLGAVLTQTGAHDEAIEALEEAIIRFTEIDPEHPGIDAAEERLQAAHDAAG